MNVSNTKPGTRRGAYKPTAEEIERACARIQSTWSARQRDKRAGRDRGSRWTPPRVEWSSISDAISDSQNESTGAGTWSDGGSVARRVQVKHFAVTTANRSAAGRCGLVLG
jgi:hypothetical protein